MCVCLFPLSRAKLSLSLTNNHRTCQPYLHVCSLQDRNFLSLILLLHACLQNTFVIAKLPDICVCDRINFFTSLMYSIFRFLFFFDCLLPSPFAISRQLNIKSTNLIFLLFIHNYDARSDFFALAPDDPCKLFFL